MSKNLQKVQDMLDGKGTGKIQTGYSQTEEILRADAENAVDGKK